MPSARSTSRGRRLKARLAVNGSQQASRSVASSQAEVGASSGGILSFRLEQGACTRLLQVEFSDVSQRRNVRNEAPAMLPLDEAALRKPLQGLVGVHEREAERIGEMVLGERKADLALDDETDIVRPQIEVQKIIGGALHGVPAAKAEEMLVEHGFLARREPGEVECQARAFLKQLPNACARKAT